MINVGSGARKSSRLGAFIEDAAQSLLKYNKTIHGGYASFIDLQKSPR